MRSMTISDTPPRPHEAYVWVWLHGSQTPVVAGRFEQRDERAGSGVVTFTYGRSYLDNPARNCWYTPWDSNPEPAD